MADTVRMDDALARNAGLEAAAALDACLARLHEKLKGLTALGKRKVEAIRAAATPLLEQLAVEEAAALESIIADEQERRVVLARLAQTMQLPEHRVARLSELLDHLPEPHASRIRAKSAGLREITENLNRTNQFVANVARRLQEHIRGVFAEVAKAHQETFGYGRDGRHSGTLRRAVVDAVG